MNELTIKNNDNQQFVENQLSCILPPKKKLFGASIIQKIRDYGSKLYNDSKILFINNMKNVDHINVENVDHINIENVDNINIENVDNISFLTQEPSFDNIYLDLTTSNKSNHTKNLIKTTLTILSLTSLYILSKKLVKWNSLLQDGVIKKYNIITFGVFNSVVLMTNLLVKKIIPFYKTEKTVTLHNNKQIRNLSKEELVKIINFFEQNPNVWQQLSLCKRIIFKKQCVDFNIKENLVIGGFKNKIEDDWTDKEHYYFTQLSIKKQRLSMLELKIIKILLEYHMIKKISNKQNLLQKLIVKKNDY